MGGPDDDIACTEYSNDNGDWNRVVRDCEPYRYCVVLPIGHQNLRHFHGRLQSLQPEKMDIMDDDFIHVNQTEGVSEPPITSFKSLRTAEPISVLKTEDWQSRLLKDPKNKSVSMHVKA